MQSWGYFLLPFELKKINYGCNHNLFALKFAHSTFLLPLHSFYKDKKMTTECNSKQKHLQSLSLIGVIVTLGIVLRRHRYLTFICNESNRESGQCVRP